MKTINNITEKELDYLLNRVFLDADMTSQINHKLTDSLAGNVLVKTSPMLTTVRFISATAIISVAATVLFLQISGDEVSSSLSFTKTQNLPGMFMEWLVHRKEKKEIAISDEKKAEKIQTTQLLPTDTTSSKNINPDPEIITPAGNPLNIPHKPMNSYQEDERLPVLSEKEIKTNEKEKRKLIKNVTKRDKKRYAPVNYNNSLLYVQTAEVTNLEYRTFLFDLLIQGKKDEFLKAKPKQSLWLNAAETNKFNYLKDHYFTSKQFDNYPVVNVSSEGAEMYCRWLTELISKESETYICRLPTEDEWTFAAAGNLNGSYPWGTDSIQNTKNRFLANFCIQKMPEKFKQPITYPTPINPKAYTSAGMALNNDSIATAQVYTYNPNNFGLYCMSGNAAEMVKTKNSVIKCKGGSWNSNLEELKIDSESDCDTPSPTTGFRVILKKQG